MGICKSKVEDSQNKHSGSLFEEDRKCRDVLFIILFVVFWIGMLVIAIVGFVNGKPERYVFFLLISLESWKPKFFHNERKITAAIPSKKKVFVFVKCD